MQNDSLSLETASHGSARPPTTLNNDAYLLSDSLQHLSLNNAAKMPLPPSPNVNSPRHIKDQQLFASSPSARNAPPSPLRRSPSTMSEAQRSSSPALTSKASASSLRNGETSATPKRPSSRRSSAVLFPSSPVTTPKSPLAPQPEEKEPVTAGSVAAEYFQKELAFHEGEVSKANAGTVVILHDSCYGHRYSRPKTSKSTLSMIVERPERILASVLGISAAYVRLGGRHAEGGSAPHPARDPDTNIPFKIWRTSRFVSITSPVVTNVHGTKWMEELKSMCESAERKLATTGKELSRADTPGQPAKEKFHEGDLYLASESLNAFQGALGGVLDGVDAVFQGTKSTESPSRAFVCIRPPGHHCSSDFPSGFCWLNNVHVGIQHAALAHGLTHAAIIDFDLHHGDGSQSITWEHNARVAKMPKNTPISKKTSIGYFSLHDINSYPCEWGDEEKVQNASLCIEQAHGQCIWNVHLQAWKTEAEFWALYESRYLVLLEKARAFLKHHTNRLRTSPHHPQPKAAIFISAGFDASEWESEGMQRHKVNVPTEFYARFTKDIVELAEEEGTGVDGRVISVLEGGYSDRALTSGVLSHLSGLCEGQISSVKTTDSRLGYEIAHQLGNLNLKDSETVPVHYDPHWWQEASLSALESIVYPAPAAVARKPKVAGPPPAYYSPTQSFSAKVVDPTKLRRSISASVKASSSPSRAPTPPLPEVEWTTAAHELSKLLIPTHRQTKSFKPEELSEPRVKKERQSIGVLPPDPSGRQLRGRKAKPTYTEPNSEEEENVSLRSASASSRRKTIADVPLTSSTEAVQPRPMQVRRRSSVASSVGSVFGDRTTSRPTSSAPSRQSSVAPSTTSANGVQVRKTREVSNSRLDITKPRAAPKEPPVPRIPSAYGKSKSSTGATTDSKAIPKGNDVDQLASNLKRISLKMPSKEEYEAKEQQKKTLDIEKKKAAPVRKEPAVRKAAAARTTKATSSIKNPTARVPLVPLNPEDPLGGAAAIERAVESMKTEEHKEKEAAHEAPTHPSHPRQETGRPQIVSLPVSPHAALQGVTTVPIAPPGSAAAMTIREDQLPKSSFMEMAEPLPTIPSPPRPDTPPPPPPSAVPQFVHYNPHPSGGNFQQAQPPTATGSTQQQVSLQWLPPNSDPAIAFAPSSPGRKQKEELPVFTANGLIPFAAPGAGALPAQAVQPPAEKENAAPDAVSPRGAEVKQEAAEKDIWEVPETPAR